jgi:hypothetical protein
MVGGRLWGWQRPPNAGNLHGVSSREHVLMALTNPLADPILGVILRVGLGTYIVYAARGFYTDPLGYFRRTLRGFDAPEWLAPVVRGLAAFCVWGGCFILATVIAVGIFHLHGDLTAVALVTVAAGMAWLLLPKARGAGSNREDRREST